MRQKARKDAARLALAAEEHAARVEIRSALGQALDQRHVQEL